MNKIRDKLQIIGANIKQFAEKYQRKPEDIQLLAVSKRHPQSMIREAFAAGQTAFGENYVQECLNKVDALKDLPLEWHFIGPLQSNKTKKIAQTASWVHTIDRLKIAKRLNEQRPQELPPLSVCIQLNISGEHSKSGIMLDQLAALATELNKLERIKLRGLMAIPAPENDFLKQRQVFSRVREAQEALIRQGFQLDTLSMGMSNDMEAAIAEGATIVRIGTAIFGKRG